MGIEELQQLTDQEMIDGEQNPFFFEPYPSEAETEEEIRELLALAALRDDPGALVSNTLGRERRKISGFLQLRPQPIGAVFNTERPDSEPVIQTGRELARWFESETPGLGHRHALNYLLRDANWSPPRQAYVWMALDIAIYSTMLAAWHYKWRSQRDQIRYRPRPIEVDYRINELFNKEVNSTGARDGRRRLFPDPSPGTPRHPSYPSGHSTVAGAASEILSYFFPDYTAEFDDLADNAGMARLWAGIHYRSDHVQGVKLGRAVAQLIIKQLQDGVVPPPMTPGVVPNFEMLPPTKEELDVTPIDELDVSRRNGHLRTVSTVAYREQARSANEGAAPSGSTADTAAQAKSPQEGAGLDGSSSEDSSQARGPQEGGV